MNEQKEPQNTPIGLTDDELDQVSGGILYKVKPGSHPPPNFVGRVCLYTCTNFEVIKKTNVICQGCPHAY